MGTGFLWVLLAIVAATVYGIINDQITVTLSPEYFSVFKRRQFALVLVETGMLNAPTRLQAVLIGTLATWWFGGILGGFLSLVGLARRSAPLTTPGFLHAVGIVLLTTFAVSVLCGIVAYFLEPLVKPDPPNWPFLEGIQEVRRAFMVGWWHNGGYLGAIIGTVVAVPAIGRANAEP